MIRFKVLNRASLVLLCLALFGTYVSVAQMPSTPAKTWWPDPSSGLMWTGRVYGGSLTGINWEKANQYCATLNIGGLTNWRLPTLDEGKAATQTEKVSNDEVPSGVNRNGVIPNSPPVYYPAYNANFFKGNIVTFGNHVWTSTMDGAKKAWTIDPGARLNSWTTSDLTSHVNRYALCVRQMEPATLALAKQAQVKSPVPDVLTLKANVPFTQAYIAYRERNYQLSITNSQAALAIQPAFAEADWAIGLDYAAMNQWDQAISSFNAALTLNKSYGDAKNALAWAQQNQKVATKGGKVKAQAPVWI